MYLVMFWLLTTALAAIIGGAASMLTQGVSAVAQGAGQAQDGGVSGAIQQTMKQYGLDPEMLKQDVQQAMGPNSQGQDQESMTSAVRDYLQGQRTDQERQQLAQTIAQKTGKSQQEAEQMIRNWEEKAAQTKEKAQEVGEKTATATGTTAILMAIIMLLGLVTAAAGACVARGPYYEEYHQRRERVR
ncbi:MAG: hypothetical protein A2Y07_05795 [Planctomycetes bacterium GWF2_50_10]|nr:MAG: hypothetical protein A2Y07_05795 [Planctomycetes bacterium GWF2_50_10]